MRIAVNGVRLYFDVDGSGLAYRDGRMVARPTLILLHGGPGYDHLAFKPFFSRFADICQVLYLDHRGQGRSTPSDPEHWRLDQWGDDVVAVCDALDIERPILLGHSFGGYVALNVATRYPSRLAKLILSCTGAWPDLDNATEAFRRFAGDAAAEAHEALQRDPTIDTLLAYEQYCGPYTNATRPLPGGQDHMSLAVPVLVHWIRGEGQSFDYREALSRVTCPTLIVAGEKDPVTPAEESRAMARSIPNSRLEVIPDAGHGTWRDAPHWTERVLREFISVNAVEPR